VGVVTSDRMARARLSQLAEPGDERLGAVIQEQGACAAVERIEAGDRSLPRVEHYQARLGLDPNAPLERIEALGGRFVVPGDSEWPTQLMALNQAAPWGLYVLGGDMRVGAVRSVALVGSRAATEYGEHVASEIATDLALSGWTVVSGGAYGIDAAGHRGALAVGGMSIAVLAFGVDTTYPKGHDALFARLRDEGALVSEHPPGSTPTKPRFLQRNRVIAALTRGTVVVEAALRSGALNTAASARRIGRPVMVVPGPVTSAQSAGCHRLARDDEPARVVTDAAEVIEEVGLIGELAERPEPTPRVRDFLDPQSLQVLEALPADGPMTPGQVSVAAGLEITTVRAELVVLLARGLVKESPGGYALVHGAADTPAR
jgi:DNA processing protein